MTLEVYRMGRDGARLPVAPRIVVGGPGGPPVPLLPMLSSEYPPCRCPQCSEPEGGR
ncbi:hypothetical protein [Streptomyces sp. NPDC014894]|uniref:hypothetical protein n=1 Tax=Streptomyces sp. NPDC014894 TaxID=3364931 RepID=UPI0036F63347